MTISAGPRSPRTATSARTPQPPTPTRAQAPIRPPRAVASRRSGQPSPTSVSSSIAMNAAAAKMTGSANTVPRRPRSITTAPTAISTVSAHPDQLGRRRVPGQFSHQNATIAIERGAHVTGWPSTWSASARHRPRRPRAPRRSEPRATGPRIRAAAARPPSDQPTAGSARMPDADLRGIGSWRVTRTAVVTKTTRPSTTIAASAGVSDQLPMSSVKPGSPMLRLMM